MNIETWASIRHLFFVERLPKKAIARKLSLDIKTIRRAIKRDTFSSGRQKPRGSKLNAFRGEIEALLESYPSLSAVRIYEEIQKIGYEGGISILRDYVKTIRPPSRVFLHIQPTAAEEAQVDWAYAGKKGGINGSGSQTIHLRAGESAVKRVLPGVDRYVSN